MAVLRPLFSAGHIVRNVHALVAYVVVSGSEIKQGDIIKVGLLRPRFLQAERVGCGETHSTREPGRVCLWGEPQDQHVRALKQLFERLLAPNSGINSVVTVHKGRCIHWVVLGEDGEVERKIAGRSGETDNDWKI